MGVATVRSANGDASPRPRVGVGACRIVLAAEVCADNAAQAVGAALAVARDLGAALLVLDLPLRALVVAPYPGRDETRLVVRGALDATTAPLLAGALTATLARRPSLLVLDLRGTPAIDEPSALALACTARGMEPWGGVLAIRRPPDPVRRVLDRCGVGELLVPCDDSPVLL